MADTQPKHVTTSQARTVGIASAIWAVSIFLSRIMGLVREQIIGRTLGASRQADLYFASFTLPDFLNYLLAAGALSIVFIPIFLEYLQRGDDDRGWEAFSVIANFILVVGTIGIALLMAFARPLASVVAPGFTDPGDVDTLVRLIRIILPAQFFHVIGGLLSAALQAQDRHFLPAMAPLVYSAGIIAGGLVGAYHAGLGADGFAWGVLVGSILGPFGLPLYGCLKTRMHWYPILSLRNPDLRRYLWLSLPIMMGFSIVVVDEWIIKNQASYLAEGALSYLQYAQDADEGADWRVRHGGRSGGLSDDKPYGRSRECGGSIWRAVPCGATDAGRNICGAGVHDIGWLRGGLPGLGSYFPADSALLMRKPPGRCFCICAWAFAAGRRRP